MTFIGWYSPTDFINLRPWFFSVNNQYNFREIIILGFLFEEIYNQGE